MIIGQMERRGSRYCLLLRLHQQLLRRLSIEPETFAVYPIQRLTKCVVRFARQMGGLECVITGIVDEFGDNFKRWHLNRRVVTLLIVASSFLVALVSLTPVRTYASR